jgi:hypothetical protein
VPRRSVFVSDQREAMSSGMPGPIVVDMVAFLM